MKNANIMGVHWKYFTLFFFDGGWGWGGGRVIGKKEGGRGGWYPNEHYGVNTKWKVGVWVYFWHFCVYCIVLNGPANACLNNNVLKFQLYQSVSPSFRLSVTLVSYFFGQSVCQMLCSKYHYLSRVCWTFSILLFIL